MTFHVTPRKRCIAQGLWQRWIKLEVYLLKTKIKFVFTLGEAQGNLLRTGQIYFEQFFNNIKMLTAPERKQVSQRFVG